MMAKLEGLERTEKAFRLFPCYQHAADNTGKTR